MGTQTITIRVAPEAAMVFNAASPDERRKWESLLSLWLIEAARSKASLREVVAEISRNAQQRGLTPEILESILHGGE